MVDNRFTDSCNIPASPCNGPLPIVPNRGGGGGAAGGGAGGGVAFWVVDEAEKWRFLWGQLGPHSAFSRHRPARGLLSFIDTRLRGVRADLCLLIVYNLPFGRKCQGVTGEWQHFYFSKTSQRSERGGGRGGGGGGGVSGRCEEVLEQPGLCSPRAWWRMRGGFEKRFEVCRHSDRPLGI